MNLTNLTNNCQCIGSQNKERFKSEPVNDMTYFTVLLRYIHQNPVKAGIADRVKHYASEAA